MLFEFQKDGLLGDRYIDDEEIENILNDQGRLGWELVNVAPVQEGLLAFLKKEIKPVVKQVRMESANVSASGDKEGEERIKNQDQVQVQEGELVRRSEKKRQGNPAKGKDDLIGGIKIS
jgi:hypothetical protein